MDPIAETPTQPRDYAVLNATYGSLLGTLLLAARGRSSEPLTGAELLPLGIATFALSKTVTQEKIESWMREPFIEEDANGERRPRGRGLRYAVGELLSCARCVGAWSALVLVALRLTSPRAGRIVVAVLGSSAINDFLQAGFAWTRERANAAAGGDERPTDAVEPPGGLRAL